MVECWGREGPVTDARELPQGLIGADGVVDGVPSVGVLGVKVCCLGV